LPGGRAADYPLTTQQLLRLRNEPGQTVTTVMDRIAASCHGIVPCNMSPNDVRPLDVNTVNGSWSDYKGEVSHMEVFSVLLHGTPRYNDVLCLGENATERVVF
jgi:hypothetical protein